MFCFILSGLPSHLSTNLSCICILLINFLPVFRLSGSDEVTLKNYMGYFFSFCSYHYKEYISFHFFWRRQWQPTPVLLPGKFHGRRSLVGYSPWGWEESDMTEWFHFHLSLPCIGEGNGNLLQYSCLENPRDGRAWWVAVYGVAQSRTRLTWLSSSRFFLVKATFMNYTFYIA